MPFLLTGEGADGADSGGGWGGGTLDDSGQPLPSEEGTPHNVLRTFERESRPASDLDCLICAGAGEVRCSVI